MPSQKVPFSIPPLNESNTVNAGGILTGGFSQTKGNGVVRFSIPAQDRLLDPSDMYLTGRFVLCDSTGATITALDNMKVSQGADLTQVGNTNVSNWGGFQNVMNKVLVQSKKSNVELSNVQNYPAYQNIRAGNSHNRKDYLVSPLTRNAANGIEGDVCRHSVVMPNATANASGDMTNLTNFTDENFGQPFSMKIETTLTSGSKPLHLGQSEMGGMLITLHLSPDNAVFHQRFRDEVIGVGGMPNAGIEGVFYRLKGLRLEGRFAVPTPDELAAYKSMMPVNERVNLINDITSSLSVTSSTPQLAATRAFVNLFLDDDQTNNIRLQQSNFRTPVGLQSYTQNINGVRTPQDFVIRAEPNTLKPEVVTGPTAGASAALLTQKIGFHGDAEVRNSFQRAIFDGRLAYHTSASLSLSNASLDSDYQNREAGDADTQGIGIQTKPDLLGIGQDYTEGIGEVQSFVNTDYSLRVNSGVKTNNANLPASRRDKFVLQESFARALAQLNTQTLVKMQ
jgi:hypothetical protein